MTHTFDTKNRATAATNPLTIEVTPTTGATVMVLGIAIALGTARTGGAPSFNGENFTFIALKQGGLEGHVEMWYLLNPSIGTYDVSIPNDNTKTLFAVASVYKAQAGYESEFDTHNTNSGNTSANPSVTLTPTVDGDVIVDVMYDGYTAVPSANTHTLLYSVDNGTRSDNHQYALQSSAGEITLGWTCPSDDWASIAAAFKEVSAGPETATDLVDGKLKIIYSASNLADGKVSIKDVAISWVDGKTRIKDVTTGLVDGKARIKDILFTSLDGKVRVLDVLTSLADGKVRIKDVMTSLADGKLSIRNVTTNLFDGKVRVKDTVTGLFDGSLSIKDIATNLFDGTVRIKDAVIGLFDGKIIVGDIFAKHEVVSISSTLCLSQELSSDITQSQEVSSNIRQSISISSIVELE